MTYVKMPYRKTYRKKTYRRRYNNKNTVKVVRREIRKDNNKENPLMWTDYSTAFNGDYVKTTPTMISIVGLIRDFIVDNPDIMNQFSTRVDPTGVGTYKEGKVMITGLQYQLRFQQNTDAVNPGANSVRHLLYSFLDTLDENNEAILQGGDIDQPPNTINLRSMFWDKVFFLKAGTTETTTDDSQFVPGTKIYKGFKKLYHRVDFYKEPSSSDALYWKQNDLRFEMASDDNSTVGEVQVYGFFRIYFRVIN